MTTMLYVLMSSMLIAQERIRTNAGRGRACNPIDISVQGRIFGRY